METQHRFKQWTLGFVVLSMPWMIGIRSAAGQTRTYTLDADFDDGALINVVHDPSDQLQLDDTVEAFNFIWVAVSSKGTAVKIDTLTGAVLGEYRTAPQGRGTNPSRTTVDQNGNAWVANRDESGVVAANAIAPGVPPVNRNMGSVIQIGLEENGQCVDRHDGTIGGAPDGIIQTSTGLGDVKGWAGGPDDLGGVSQALDECIIHYTRVNATGTRHVSVDANNDVWVSGAFGSQPGFFDLIDDSTGQIIRQETAAIEPTTNRSVGGYGGLIDPNGVIWSARNGDLTHGLRWDTAQPLTGSPTPPPWLPPSPGPRWNSLLHDTYGLCIDSQGNVWNTELAGGHIRKFAPNGIQLGRFDYNGTLNTRAQGCVVDGNDDVWVAHALDVNVNTIGHLLNDGTFVGNVVLSDANVGPTGVAVDGAGKIWATGFRSFKVYRIDPTLGAVGGGGATIGAEDFVSVDLGGQLYNYSDMTGSTLTAAPDNGTWTIIHDCGVVDFEWGTVTWTPAEPGDSSITVTAASSNDGVNFGPAETVTNGVDLTVADGQFLKVVVSFTRATNIDSDGNGVNDSPILFDLTIQCNSPPDCDANGPYAADCAGTMTNVGLDGSGSSDPDGDSLSFSWTTDCPGGAFDDATSATPVLTVDTAPGCQVDCTVTLTVDDGLESAGCQATVTIQDTTDPDVSCSVTVVPDDDDDDSDSDNDDDEDDGDDDDGGLLIEFAATDNCGVVSVSAVIEIVCLENDDDDDDGAGDVQIPVDNGQTIEVECDDDDCEVELDDGILEIEGSTATLIVTATDECGNEATCTVELCAPDNDDDEDVGEALNIGVSRVRGIPRLDTPRRAKRLRNP